MENQATSVSVPYVPVHTNIVRCEAQEKGIVYKKPNFNSVVSKRLEFSGTILFSNSILYNCTALVLNIPLTKLLKLSLMN